MENVLLNSNKALVLEVQKKTLFIKLEFVYPECFFLIEDQPKLFPFICLFSSCHRNSNCMEKLAKRVKYIFDVFTEASLLFLYFRYRNDPDRQKAGVFWRDMTEPRLITMNPYAWNKMKEIGIVYEWDLPQDFYMDKIR